MLEHIQECIDRVREYTAGERSVFFGSRLVQDAVIRNLQTLAESTQRLSEPLRNTEADVPWRGIAGFRNVLTHGYLGLDPEVVWSVVEQDLPGLAEAVARMRRALEGWGERMTSYLFLQPLDVLNLRGNKLFGDPGSFGESLIPPWPSVAAGALRSQLLARDGTDPLEFASGRVEHPALGTPRNPGPFTVTAFHLARRGEDRVIDALYVPPADLVIGKVDDGSLRISCLRPTRPADGLLSSAALPELPVLAEQSRGKAVGGYWLTKAGWRKYLGGGIPGARDLVESAELWKLDFRVGVGLDPVRRRADDGKLFAAQAMAPASHVGFLVGVDGVEPPTEGVVRFGGDGRGAAVFEVPHSAPQADLKAVAEARRCRIVLTTPGLFPDGWKMPGVDADGRFHLGEVSGRLACAAVPRAEVVSGWDLAQRLPKPALRAAPAGSVYWLEGLEATPDQLRKLADTGLWREDEENTPRRAEGFNRFTFAVY